MDPKSTPAPAPAVFALDVSSPSKPHLIVTWIPPRKDWMTHSVSISRNGTRAYVVLMRFNDDQTKATNPNGLVILDISDIQARRVNPQFRVISTLFWDDTHVGQLSMPMMIHGRPYLSFTDMAGSVGLSVDHDVEPSDLSHYPPADGCGSGRPAYGFARLIDLGDETHPQIASKLMLEVDDPARCQQVVHDPAIWGAYAAFGCSPDDAENAKLLACNYWEGGLRVFDIRNPSHPTEIAYYKPPARRKDRTADALLSIPTFHNGRQEIWFASCDNGFQVVRFSDRFRAVHKDLFRD